MFNNLIFLKDLLRIKCNVNLGLFLELFLTYFSHSESRVYEIKEFIK